MSPKNKMTKSIVIDNYLWWQFKSKCAKEHRTMTDVITKLIEDYVQ